jgi:putative transposase
VKLNHKRIERLYREEGLAVRRRKRKRVARDGRGRATLPEQLNQQWASASSVTRWLGPDEFGSLRSWMSSPARCLATEVDTSLPGGRVVCVLEQLVHERGTPDEIVLDNGPELSGKVVDQWAYERGVALCSIEPGKPIQNAFVESFQGRLRDEFLDRHWFLGLSGTRQ